MTNYTFRDTSTAIMHTILNDDILHAEYLSFPLHLFDVEEIAEHLCDFVICCGHTHCFPADTPLTPDSFYAALTTPLQSPVFTTTEN